MPYTLGSDDQLGSSSLGGDGAAALSDPTTLTEFCDILENQGDANGMGGFLDDWQPIATNVPCAVIVKTPAMEKVEGEKETAVGVYEFRLPSSQAITPANRIRFQGYIFVVQNRSVAIPNIGVILVYARLVE